MREDKAAIVLCAGIGSRMKLPGNINKCAAKINTTSAVKHNVSTLLAHGYNKISIVTGFAEASVIGAAGAYRENPALSFIYNGRYDYHGCNYSLACGILSFTKLPVRLLIIEGDSLHNPLAVGLFNDVQTDCASLVRKKEYINLERSVIAVGADDVITKYFYNQKHKSTPPELTQGEEIIGESMQIWSFAGKPLGKLYNLLKEYKDEADSGDKPMTESGVYSINMLNTPIAPIFTSYPDDWINLNTQNDYSKTEGIKWLRK